VREAVSILGQLAAVANRNDFREIESDILAEVACLSEEHVELAVTGRFCVGKSTFLNALLNSSGPVGEAGMHQGPLPDDALPSATVVTRIVYARRAFVRARYVDGRQEEWTFKRYSAQMEVHPTDTLTAFDLGLPATLLRDGLTLVEFPGIPDTGRPVAAVTSPAAVMVLRSDALASQEEMKFAGELLRRTDKLFVVVNIIHKQSADQRLRAFVEHRIQLLRQSPGGDTLDSTIYYIQCRLASVGYLSGDEALVRQSGIQAFEQRLHLWLSDAVSVKATRAISRFAELADVLTLQLEARRTGAERDSDRTVSAGDIEDDLIRVARCRSQFAQNQSDQ
jgi:hypothetical protein